MKKKIYEVTRKEIEDHEKTAEKTLANCELSRQKLKKSEKLMIDLRTGISTLIDILKNNKIFEETFNNSNEEIEVDNKIVLLKDFYYGLFKLNTKEELKNILENMNHLFKYIEKECIRIKQNYHYDEEEKKLDKKEENEIGNIYIEQRVDSNPDSEYGPEEDIDPELPNKDNGNQNDFNMRPYSAAPGKRNKISIQARNKY